MTQENQQNNAYSFEEFAKLNNEALKFKPSKNYKNIKLAPVLGAFNAQFKENKEMFSENLLKEIDDIATKLKTVAETEWKEAQAEVDGFLTNLVSKVFNFHNKEVKEEEAKKIALKIKGLLTVLGADLEAETVFYTVKIFYLD